MAMMKIILNIHSDRYENVKYLSHYLIDTQIKNLFLNRGILMLNRMITELKKLIIILMIYFLLILEMFFLMVINISYRKLMWNFSST